MALDPNYTDVALLLWCNGADGSPVFPDQSATPKTVSAVGNAAVDTDISKWGGGAAFFDGSGDYLSVSTSALALAGIGTWTVECWIRLQALPGVAAGIFFNGSTSSDLQRIQLQIGATGAVSAYLQAAAGTGVTIATTTTLSPGTWYHVAVVKSATSVKIFIDGVESASGTYSTAITSISSFYVGLTRSGGTMLSLNGHIDDFRVTTGVARYTANFTRPAEQFPDYDSFDGRASAPSPLGAPALVGRLVVPDIAGSATAPSPLVVSVQLVGFTDFTGLLGTSIVGYAMDLITPGGTVRVPISSWQATLRTGGSCYAQCVVPACSPWVAALSSATAFRISRVALIPDGTAIEHVMLDSPVDTLAFDRGPQRHTATLSGYSPGLIADAAPPAIYDRSLMGLRSVSLSGDNVRVRCAIDWLLRPGHRAYVEGSPMIVDYINYYAMTTDEYCDVGGAP